MLWEPQTKVIVVMWFVDHMHVSMAGTGDYHGLDLSRSDALRCHDMGTKSPERSLHLDSTCH